MQVYTKIFTCFYFGIVVAPSALAVVSVKAYTRADGTPVRAHYRSDPNGIGSDNFSYSGNRNPYTGMAGGRHYAPIGYGQYVYFSKPVSYRRNVDNSWRAEVKANVDAKWEAWRTEVRAKNERRRPSKSSYRLVSHQSVGSAASSLISYGGSPKYKLPKLEIRKWTSLDGRFSVFAILHSVSRTNLVRLYQVSEGKRLVIQLQKLSLEDQEYVREKLIEAGDYLRPYNERTADQFAQSR